MTITDAAATPRVRVDRGRAHLEVRGRTATLHPLWLRNRSQEPGQIEPASRQRLFTPKDIALDLRVHSCAMDLGTLVVSFTDGHTARLDLAGIERALGWTADHEEPRRRSPGPPRPTRSRMSTGPTSDGPSPPPAPPSAEALAVADPEAHRACCETEVEFRYQTIDDTAVNRGALLDYDRQGRFRQIRLNTKLDAPIPPADGDLDAFSRGRRRLIDWLDDPAHGVAFRLEPGDVLFMDNMRVLHGRTSFDAARGVRHLQGAYIDHDGPDTLYRLTVRRLRSPDLPPGLHHGDEEQR